MTSTATTASDPTADDRQGPARTRSMTIDGQKVDFAPGETIYEVARRLDRDVPTLCYDPRLEPFGACRLCVVEIEGQARPVASCTTKATAGMVVRTVTDALEAHRRTLLELVISENRDSGDAFGAGTPAHVDPLRGASSQELSTLAARYRVRPGRHAGAHSGHSRRDDDNPFILRDYDLCISCYRCVRVCDEREGDHAIHVGGRGFESRILTEFEGHLADSSCTFCGQCVQTCPTGALADKKALRAVDLPGELTKTRTICPYCGVGCSVDIVTKGDRMVAVQPAFDGPANEGALCVKGQFAWDHVQHDERLRTPLVRGADGVQRPATWDEALDRAADGFRRAAAEHGAKAVYAIASGRAPHESAYTIQKFIRAGFGTNYIDNCSRA
ncbi:MAG: (2Fe-2S)-binding protein [Planctomycetes bacterium]|nr:(2Fe-2S)-binding protein [Planctomycetota bacterium]